MVEFKSLLDLQKTFPTEKECIEFLEQQIWNGKPVSPFDPTSKVYKCANNRYKCKNANKYFNIKTKTIFENSKLPLKKWLITFYVFFSSKKGISSYQLAKYIDITQKSAWFILQSLTLCF